jgi:hypothetical protein
METCDICRQPCHEKSLKRVFGSYTYLGLTEQLGHWICPSCDASHETDCDNMYDTDYMMEV